MKCIEEKGGQIIMEMKRIGGFLCTDERDRFQLFQAPEGIMQLLVFDRIIRKACSGANISFRRKIELYHQSFDSGNLMLFPCPVGNKQLRPFIVYYGGESWEISRFNGWLEMDYKEGDENSRELLLSIRSIWGTYLLNQTKNAIAA